jgi:hypothetical protein
MERKVKLSFGLQLLAMILLAGISWAAVSITVSGSWFETIDQSDLAGGAGSDLVSTYESAADQVVIDITGVGKKGWRVDVRKIDSGWYGDLHLCVHRTSDGTGPGSISGGTSYQEIGDTYQQFFTGESNRRDIYVQLMLDGVSARMPCGNYHTTVYYTVMEVD